MSDDEIIEKIEDKSTNWIQTLGPEEQIFVFERLFARSSLPPEAREEMLRDTREYIYSKHKN